MLHRRQLHLEFLLSQAEVDAILFPLERTDNFGLRSLQTGLFHSLTQSRGLQLVLLDGEVNVAPLERALKTVYEKFRSDGDEAWADLVLDGQDFVHGWCAPGMEIPEAQTA